jgi:hypothetical protein
MKKALRISLSALVLTLFLVPVTFAQSASGGFEAKSDLGLTTIKFSAQGFSNGSASGDIGFSGPLSIPNQDVDGDGGGDPGVKEGTLTLDVSVDCMKVAGNRAVLSGLVKSSSNDTYVRRRMILTVEDGDALKTPDSFTWGQYPGSAPTWVASDAELKEDPGVGLQWYATDAERDDDVGISSSQPAGFDCQSFTLASYALDALSDGSGDIVVKP